MERKIGRAHSWHFFRFGISIHLISGLLVCLFSSTVAAAQNNDHDTLLYFKTLTTENSPDFRQPWFTWNESDETPCAWIGVTCTANYYVEGLDFSGWGVDPRLPYLDMLSVLKDLRRLDLSFNSARFRDLSKDTVSGEINGNQIMTMPEGIGALTGLIYMDLSRNDYEGDIPNSISGCKNLQELYLGDNLLEGGISALAGMPSLQILSLVNNRLNGSFPNFTEMPSLAILNLANNRLTGNLSDLSNFPVLQYLNLDNNDFTELEDSFFNSLSINIEQLSLSGNQLQGRIPPSVVNLPSVMVFNLSDNQLSGPLTSQRFRAPFFILDLSQNKLSGDIVDFLFDLEAENIWTFFLVEMHLQNNQFTGDMSRIAVNLEARTQSSWWNCLKVLDLSNNHLGWSTSETIPDPVSVLLGNLPESLTELRVGGNDFSGISLPIDLQSGNGTRNLQVLDLSDNHLTGHISSTVFSSAGLPSLQNLNLSNNEATGPIPTDISSLNLTVLSVSNNRLSGSLSFIQPGSPLYNAGFFAGNTGLCDGPLAPCNAKSGLPLWVVLAITAVSAILVMGSSLVAAWRWWVYNRRHQQDAELIKTLLEGESATLMSLQELKTATNNFAESAQIGEGGFGKVYEGELNDGTRVAIKKSKREGFEKNKQQFLNEVRILTQINHRHLVKLLGCCMENKVAVLVFDFVSNGTLQEHLQGKCGGANLSWKQRLNIAVQTADALNYLHSAATVPIYHRDVKSANILLNEDLSAKVADFGISKLVPLEVTHISTMALQGTIGYMDPEYYTSFKLTDRSDVYGFGVVLLELISAKPAVDFQRCEEESSLVIFAKPHIESGDLDQLIDPCLLETYLDTTGQGRESILSVGRLAVKCLNMRSKARPSMQEAWQELQNLWLLLLQLEGTQTALEESMNEDTSEDPQRNFIDFLRSESSSSSTIQSKTRGIEMSDFSRS